MKKLFVMIMAFLILAVPVTAFAAEETITSENGSQSIDVQAKYTNGTTTPDVYSVDVTWGAMQFTYSASGTKEWDPSTHQYTDNTTTGWSASGNTVTVTNHSNKDVDVTFAYAKTSGFDGVSGAFSVESDTLAAGAEGNVGGADSVSTELTLSGTLASTVTEFTKVGSITVSLS